MDDTIETEIELPDSLFRRGEELAQDMKISRSELYALALQDFISLREKKDVASHTATDEESYVHR